MVPRLRCYPGDLDIRTYLERIGYRGPLDVSLETLRELHLAHLYTVPFENLHIQMGLPLSLDVSALFDKVVRRRRGGFCYELNGLFCAVLRELGFKVTMLSACVAGAAARYSPEFDHLTLRVDVEEPWLVDVGFGDGFRLPVRLENAAEHNEDRYTYRVIGDGEYRVLQRRETGGDWTPQYRFTLRPRAMDDFADRCHYHQTSPESHFTRNRICTLATPEGRITLSGMRLIVTTGGEKTERELSEDEYAAIMRERFAMIE